MNISKLRFENKENKENKENIGSLNDVHPSLKMVVFHFNHARE
jgi:hypothetical protein